MNMKTLIQIILCILQMRILALFYLSTWLGATKPALVHLSTSKLIDTYLLTTLQSNQNNLKTGMNLYTI